MQKAGLSDRLLAALALGAALLCLVGAALDLNADAAGQPSGALLPIRLAVLVGLGVASALAAWGLWTGRAGLPGAAKLLRRCSAVVPDRCPSPGRACARSSSSSPSPRSSPSLPTGWPWDHPPPRIPARAARSPKRRPAPRRRPLRANPPRLRPLPIPRRLLSPNPRRPPHPPPPPDLAAPPPDLAAPPPAAAEAPPAPADPKPPEVALAPPVAPPETVAPPPAAPPEVETLPEGHRDAVVWLDVSPDGKIAGQRQHRPHHQTLGPRGQALAARSRRAQGHGAISAVPARGTEALTAGDDGEIVLRSVADGAVLHVFSASDHSGANKLAVSRDGKRAVSVHELGAVIVWDLDKKSALHVLKGHDWPIVSVAISPTARWR